MRIARTIRRRAVLHRTCGVKRGPIALASPQKVKAFVFLRAGCHSFLSWPAKAT
jgi:hypothetical protein